MLLPLLLHACFLAPLPASSQQAATAGAPRLPGRLLVSGYHDGGLHAYRTQDGKPLGTPAPVPGAQSIVIGPGGYLFVCAESADRVLRIDPDTLTVLEARVADDPATPEDENGPLNGPTAAVFGPDGNLYVASFETDSILRYHGRTGAYLGPFVPSGSGGLDGPDAGTKFGPDGDLYVPSFWNDRVLRYDGLTGAYLGDFIPARRGSLRQPRDLVFHRGLWYVASSQNGRVLRYDSAGNFVDVFATANSPYSLAFHPLDGNLYVANQAGNHVRIHDGLTGAFLRRAFPAGSGGLSGATFVCFVP